MSRALVIAANDNVATALEPLRPGQAVRAGSRSVTVVESIPRGHKVALQHIAAGGTVVKYGSAIGIATANIAAGAHVHVHNLASTRGRGDLASQTAADRTQTHAPNPSSVPAAAAPRIAEPPDLDRPAKAAEPSP